MELDDRVAVVTGGSTGIGRATARELALEGARVTICACTAPDLEEAAGLIVDSVRLPDRGTVSEVEIRPVNP